MTLEYVARGLVQALAAHFLVSTLLALVVAVLWRTVDCRDASASVTAWRIFMIRMAPAIAGLLTGLLVALGYALWERRGEPESVGVVAVACATGGLLLIATAAWRGIWVMRQTQQVQRVLAGATEETLPALPLPAFVVESRFPVVALAGLLRSRLFVARTVIDACTPDEFDAVVAHEQAHARQHDNLRRLAMAAAPDPLGMMTVGREMSSAWLAASELAADESAARRPTRGLHLASALVKVARLATTPEPVTASALYRGEPIAERVHRLLDPPTAQDARPWPLGARALTSALLLCAALYLLPTLHAAAERLLQFGP